MLEDQEETKTSNNTRPLIFKRDVTISLYVISLTLYVSEETILLSCDLISAVLANNGSFLCLRRQEATHKKERVMAMTGNIALVGIFLNLPNSSAEIITPMLMILQSEDSGRRLGSEGYHEWN
jgi:hypothetical protein